MQTPEAPPVHCGAIKDGKALLGQPSSRMRMRPASIFPVMAEAESGGMSRARDLFCFCAFTSLPCIFERQSSTKEVKFVDEIHFLGGSSIKTSIFMDGMPFR
ncbi:MAG: hypothetical protein IKH11_01130 [Bacteroidales bacterium]|nr:hypothetical protein [Bacteroidales bacterium]